MLLPDVLFTRGLLVGFQFLSLLLFLFLLTLELFGLLAFHKVEMERADFRLTQKIQIARHESLHFLQLCLQLILFLMALLLVGRVFRFKPCLFFA